MANQTHVSLLERGKSQWNSWRRANMGLAPDLREIVMPGFDFRGYDLSNAILSGSDIRNSDFEESFLYQAELYQADLRQVNAQGCDMRGAKLHETDLRDADLSLANLYRVDFIDTRLEGADFYGVLLASTTLSGVDLGPLANAEKIRYAGPSCIDWRSIAKSSRAVDLTEFLIRAGMPESVAVYTIDSVRAISMDTKEMMQSTFISYGGPDEKFAIKIQEALQKNGVRTFLFSKHARLGEKLHRVMREGVRDYDRVLLICSKSSLERKGVLNEIEETLAREAREGGMAYLVPITLDSYVFSEWDPARGDLAQAVRDRVIGDFSGSESDPKKFQATFVRLLEALKKK